MSESSSIHIRAVADSDRADWRALWHDYLAFYETALPDDIYDTTFARLLGDDPQDFHGLMAFDGDRAVGLTHYLFHRHAWKRENTCYLQDLYTAPDLRGRGVGRALIEAVYAAADRAGAPSVYWLTQEHNQTARLLYDRIGRNTGFIRYSR